MHTISAMPKQIGIAVGIILLLGLGVFAYTKYSPSSPLTSYQPSAPAGTAMTKGSIQSLLSAGQSVSCTITYPSDKGGYSGTTYVSGNKVRADFTIKDASGKMMYSHTIQDGTYGYIWTDGVAQGTKIKVDTMTKTPPTTGSQPSTQSQNVDLNAQLDMKCSAWSPDASMFTPPTTIQFTDLSAMVKQVPKGACDQITDPTAKAACLSAMGGN